MHRDRAIFPRETFTWTDDRFFTIPACPFEFTIIRIAVARKSLPARVIRGELEKPSVAIGDTSAAVDAYFNDAWKGKDCVTSFSGESIDRSLRSCKRFFFLFNIGDPHFPGAQLNSAITFN